MGLLVAPCVRHVHAQQQAELPATSRNYVVASDPLTRFRTERVPGGRMDMDLGILRAAYRLSPQMDPEATPEATARAWLDLDGGRFGISSTQNLELIRNLGAHGVRHLTFQQTHGGIRVYGRFVQVNLGVNGLPTMVQSGYAPHLENAATIPPNTVISSSQAQTLAQQAVSMQGAQTSDAELLVYPESTPRLVWRVIAMPDDFSGEWEVLLDATTGELVHLLDRLVRARPHTKHGHALPDSLKAREDVLASGTGLVWIPDPLTSAGVDYGGDYQDFGDSDTDALNNERIEVALSDITRGADGLYRLEGPYVRIDGSFGGTQWQPPAEADSTAFQYTRSDERFEAVMVYYHIDASQRYVQSLDIGRDIKEAGIRANPHGLGDRDQSVYSRFQNALAFGDGGIDDAEDAEVIIHEYGHALLDGSTAVDIFERNREGGAIHEGWSDYWAVSYTRGLMESGAVPQGDWRKVFSWDGNVTWDGRYLQTSARYPEDTLCNNSVINCDIYSDGVVFATTLMSIWEELGQSVTDRLNLFSHAYLSPPATMVDAAEALLQADQDLYGGANTSVLVKWLADRGYLNAAEFAPTLTHSTTSYHEDVSQPFVVDALINERGISISEATVWYSEDGNVHQSTNLVEQSDNKWTVSIAFRSTTTRADYYIQVKAGATRVTLPANAPEEQFSVIVGPDTLAPEVSHRPLTHVVKDAWPATIAAIAEDNFGLESVRARYSIESKSGEIIADDWLELSNVGDSTFAADFPSTSLEVGTRVRYRLQATDVAQANNTTNVPPEDQAPFRIDITEQGLLSSWDGSDLVPTGNWMRGDSVYGPIRFAVGDEAWATILRGPYTEEAGLHTLSLPSVNLLHYPDAYLEFWHWYDFEHSGRVEPGIVSGILQDGGNIKVSVDAGTTWTVLQPEVSYNGMLEGERNNPLAGQAAFGGFSYGWRRVLAPLPDAPDSLLRYDTLIQFDFASGQYNSDTSAYGYAGWVIDDVKVRAERPQDNTVPSISVAPPARIEITDDASLPILAVSATDNVGIATVLVNLSVSDGSGESGADTVRLPQIPGSLERFRGRLPVVLPAGPQSAISYGISVWDFDGNSIEQSGFLISRTAAGDEALFARAEATGLWQAENGGFNTAPTGMDTQSTIYFSPVDLPDDSDTAYVTIGHAYRLGTSAGGNLKVSTDEGQTWEVVSGPYDTTYAAMHPMQEERVFAGSADSLRESQFIVPTRAAQSLWFRVDLATAGGLREGDYWRIEKAIASVKTTTAISEPGEVPEALALLPNFPDPFARRTTVTYSLPARAAIRLEVFNMLGQRVQLVMEGTQPPGTHILPIDLGGQGTGVYILRMTTESRRLTEPLVVVR